MTETTADNRQAPLDTHAADAHPLDTHPLDTHPADTELADPLDRIAAELDGLGELDPAEAVEVLAEITSELNKELDADTDRS
ncbi:MAG: hypothetical protein OEQ47_01585 [Acidimicrobiia bacterium]|nr:hypothetical protein [Acidimicrobiia bacterium]